MDRAKNMAPRYMRLIKAGRKTIKDVPADVLPHLREIAPELFEDAH